MSKVEIKEQFYIEGKACQIISGAIHYFRVVPEYWQDRLEKLKNMGCNTVETYIPWNFHEPKKNEFHWEGIHDICKFIEIAQNLGLYIIIRPSPYICAEWEFGGLPSWLLADSKIKLRCSCETYLNHIKDYYEVLIPKLVPYQIDNGGKIILMQIENEYGYYGNDKSYLKYLADLMKSLGVTVPFVTSDGPWSKDVFTSGQLEGVLPTGNFGSACEWQFSQMKKMMPKNLPLMNMEFWAGWFDAWGNKKKKHSILKVNELDYDYVIKNNHNINIYMFHGGTNFGFMNGSNYYGKLTPDTTSYDYDAPLSESGQFTPKYFAFREILKKNLGEEKIPNIKFSTKITQKNYGKITWNKTCDLLENIELFGESKKSVYPLSMEDVGQSTGYIFYRTKLKDDENATEIIFKKCADRVQVFEDDKKLFTAFDKEITSDKKGLFFRSGKTWKINTSKGANLGFLVENMGRVNFGQDLESQKKGISDNVLINTHSHFDWEIFTLPFDEKQMKNLEKVSWKEESSKNPSFYKFEFEIELPKDEFTDTYLDFSGWGKGFVLVNGFNIGRFWEIGPQKSLYIPGPLLHNGKNEIIIFESEGKSSDSITLCDEMLWKN